MYLIVQIFIFVFDLYDHYFFIGLVVFLKNFLTEFLHWLKWINKYPPPPLNPFPAPPWINKEKFAHNTWILFSKDTFHFTVKNKSWRV